MNFFKRLEHEIKNTVCAKAQGSEVVQEGNEKTVPSWAWTCTAAEFDGQGEPKLPWPGNARSRKSSVLGKWDIPASCTGIMARCSRFCVK